MTVVASSTTRGSFTGKVDVLAYVVFAWCAPYVAKSKVRAILGGSSNFSFAAVDHGEIAGR